MTRRRILSGSYDRLANLLMRFPGGERRKGSGLFEGPAGLICSSSSGLEVRTWRVVSGTYLLVAGADPV